MCRAVILEPDVGKAGFAQQALKFGPIAEALRGVPRRDFGRGCKADLRDSFAEKALDALLAKIIPPGQRNPTALFYCTQTLRNSCLGSREMPKPEAADSSVKRGLGKGQSFDVSLVKFDARIPLPRQLDHLAR
jgi:hypothetical protein